MTAPQLLGAADVRALAARLQLRPTKTLGQNFVVDPGTVRRVVRTAELAPGDAVVEVGPGLGSLTLGLLARARSVVAIEVDAVLAAALPGTVARYAPQVADRLHVVRADARRVKVLPGPEPTTLVANLPYNVAVPVLLHLLAALPSLDGGLVMVQTEVAERLAAGPGSRAYGIPSAKFAYYASARLAGPISRNAFWPVPNVDSGLVAFARRSAPGSEASRDEIFGLIDAAFGQRRKTLRAALGDWAGSPSRAEKALRAAGIDPAARGESLGITEFARLAEHRPPAT